MNPVYISVKEGDLLDQNLFDAFLDNKITPQMKLVDWVKEQSSSILKVKRYSKRHYRIFFKDEASKTLFVVKWS